MDACRGNSQTKILKIHRKYGLCEEMQKRATEGDAGNSEGRCRKCRLKAEKTGGGGGGERNVGERGRLRSGWGSGMEGAPDHRRQTALHGRMRCHGYQILKGSAFRKTIIRPGRRGRAVLWTHTHIHAHMYKWVNK